MTIFSKIISGVIPSYKIAENDHFLAFLDIYPQVEGHVLVVPKTEVDKFFDLGDEYLSQMLLFAKPIANAIEKSFPCNRCGMIVLGLDVPHAHLHLLPINSASDLNFNRNKLTVTHGKLQEIQQKILAAMAV
ncbi:MAG: HIT family protein [Sediminibacterium sp.]|nr:HIT family protein [Sediminibacterium sp.]